MTSPKNRIVSYPNPHPQCAACAMMKEKLDRVQVADGRTREENMELRSLLRKVAPDAYARYCADVVERDLRTYGLPVTGDDGGTTSEL